MPAHREGEAGTGAGVRKPPGKEPASDEARRCRGHYGDFEVTGWAPDWAERGRAEHAGLAIGRDRGWASGRQVQWWWEWCSICGVAGRSGQPPASPVC